MTVPPVVAEIHYGIERLDTSSKKYLLLKLEKDRLLSIFTVLPWTPAASRNFGKIKADLERREKIIDDFNIAISAISLAHKCGVITANLNRFKRIKNLKTKSWAG